MEPQRMFTPHGAPIREGMMLPVQPPPQLIGRSRELNAVQSTLKIGAAVLLYGGAGMGKTALAATIANTFVNTSIGGVLWFNAYEDDFATLLARVGRAYNLTASDSANDPAYVEQVRATLEKNQPLLVVDGMVDLDAAREFMRGCATGIPTLLINEFSGGGPWTPIEIEALSFDDSRELLKLSSQLTDPLYQDDIAALCRFLSGNPLAIELAARLITADDLTPAEILASIPSSSGHDGHLLMMTLAFKKLQPSTQALLLVLAAMFSGSASVELLGDLSDVPTVTIIPLMQQLVARGLAREATINGRITYSLHEVAQAFTRHWLLQYQHLNGAENRALRAVIKYAERRTRDGSEGYGDLAAEMPNIMGAAAFATSSGQAGLLRQLINILTVQAGNFIAARGFQNELRQLQKLNSLLAPAQPGAPVRQRPSTGSPSAPTSLPENEATLAMTQEAPEEPNPLEPLLDSQATPSVSTLEIQRPPTLPPADGFGDFTFELLNELEEATVSMDDTQNDRLGDTQATQQTPPDPMHRIDDTQPRPLSDPLFTDSPSHTFTDSIIEPPRTFDDTDVPTERSIPSIKGQIDRARQSGDTYTQANLLHAVGRHYAERGDATQGMAYEKEALELYEAMNDTGGILGSLDTLATITAKMDDVEGALLYATRGVNLAESFGDKTRLGRLQMRLADVRLALDDLPAAIQTYSQAAESLRSAEDWYNVGLVMSKLGTAYLEQRMFREGLMMLEQALIIFQKEQKSDAIGRVLGSMATGYAGLQQWDQAQNYFMQAVAVTQQNSDQAGELAHLISLAYVRRMQENIPGAADAYREALHLAYELDDQPSQGEITYELGSLLIEHPNTINMGLQLLQESQAITHSDEAAQLIRRATKRIERAKSAGLPLPPAENSRQFAAKGYTGPR